MTETLQQEKKIVCFEQNLNEFLGTATRIVENYRPAPSTDGVMCFVVFTDGENQMKYTLRQQKVNISNGKYIIVGESNLTPDTMYYSGGCIGKHEYAQGFYAYSRDRKFSVRDAIFYEMKKIANKLANDSPCGFTHTLSENFNGKGEFQVKKSDYEDMDNSMTNTLVGLDKLELKGHHEDEYGWAKTQKEKAPTNFELFEDLLKGHENEFEEKEPDNSIDDSLEDINEFYDEERPSLFQRIVGFIKRVFFGKVVEKKHKKEKKDLSDVMNEAFLSDIEEQKEEVRKNPSREVGDSIQYEIMLNSTCKNRAATKESVKDKESVNN